MLTAALAAMTLAAPDRMDWWREARFGMFIHWGVYAVPAGEWGGSTGHGEWIMETGKVPMDQYRQWRDQFNPTQFDADAWAAAAKQAGMKYLVITTKHHDGFALYDSAASDWDIMSTPFKRDIMKEIAEACRRQGLKIGWYHSIMDWSHPDWGQRRAWAVQSPEPPDMDRFQEHLHKQVTELLTNYGKIDVLWFDGEWESPWTVERGRRLEALVRGLQPEIIINNRVGPGREGMADASLEMGDFGTPEQNIPAEGVPGLDWESCMTMNANWGWNKNDQNWKSSVELIQNLSDIVSKGGNYLLNVGPEPTGIFPAQAVRRLEELGAWMAVNGEAVHGTTASPIGSFPWGRATQKGEKVYLHIWEPPADGRLNLPSLATPILSARQLGGGALGAQKLGEVWSVAAPLRRPNGMPVVVELTLKGQPAAHAAPVVQGPPAFVGRASVSASTAIEGAELRWTADGSAPTAASPRTSGSIVVLETAELRVQAFRGGLAVGPESRLKVSKAPELAASQTAAPADTGWKVKVYEGAWDRLPDFSRLTPVSEAPAESISTAPAGGKKNIGLVFEGWLHAPEARVITPRLTSDDGARLYIGGQLVVDNDGLHAAQEKRGLAALAPGWHRVRVEWFNRTGGASLSLRWD